MYESTTIEVVKRNTFLKGTILSVVIVLAMPLPAYAFYTCTYNPVVTVLVSLITLGIVLSMVYFPFNLIKRIKSEKSYPKFFSKIHPILFSLLFLLPFILPAIAQMFYLMNFDTYIEDWMNPFTGGRLRLSELLAALLPILFILRFAFWVGRRYGTKWEIILILIAFGATAINLLSLLPGMFAHCSGGLPKLP